jgi:hypothetical protein
MQGIIILEWIVLKRYKTKRCVDIHVRKEVMYKVVIKGLGVLSPVKIGKCIFFTKVALGVAGVLNNRTY